MILEKIKEKIYLEQYFFKKSQHLMVPNTVKETGKNLQSQYFCI